MLHFRNEARTLQVPLVLLDPEALENVLRYPFEYRDESELPSELFGLALDASGESCLAFSTLQTLLEVEDVPLS